MYVYIYEDIAGKGKYKKDLVKLEKKITDLGLTGKIIRLEKLSDSQKIIQNELKYGVKTVVAVGNDCTVNKVINSIFTTDIKEVPALGIVPLEEKNNKIANALGIKSVSEAGDILLARRLEKINLMEVNNSFVLSQVTAPEFKGKIIIDSGFNIELNRAGQINVINFSLSPNIPEKTTPDPRDNKLELCITNTAKKFSGKEDVLDESFFSLSKLTIENHSIIADNCLNISSPARVKSSKKRINLIVGKKRFF